METEQETKQEQEKGVKITYETLFDLLRNEKTRESLQKLDESFYADVRNYMLEKNTLLESQEKGSDLFSATEKDKTEKQLINARRIIKEIYDRREKKIISMALNKSRISSNLIDTSVLLEEEKKVFEQIVGLLNNYRNNILLNAVEGKEPVFSEVKPEKAEVEEERKEEQESKEQDNPKKTVKIIKPVQRFVGKELEVYGPFEEGGTAELPVEIAELLIDKGSAEEV